jgi:hypothetical protein
MGKEEEKAAVYRNRRRIRGARGKRLLRQRGERVERSFAHLYETGALRRTHLRRHDNIIKRLMIHASAFNLGLVMRKLSTCGTPRGLQGRIRGFFSRLHALFYVLRSIATAELRRFVVHLINPADRSRLTSPDVSYELSI